MRHVHHIDIETDVRHVVRQEIGDCMLLEGRTRDADERLLEIENALGVDILRNAGERGDRLRVRHGSIISDRMRPVIIFESYQPCEQTRISLAGGVLTSCVWLSSSVRS